MASALNDHALRRAGRPRPGARERLLHSASRPAVRPAARRCPFPAPWQPAPPSRRDTGAHTRPIREGCAGLPRRRTAAPSCPPPPAPPEQPHPLSWQTSPLHNPDVSTVRRQRFHIFNTFASTTPSPPKRILVQLALCCCTCGGGGGGGEGQGGGGGIKVEFVHSNYFQGLRAGPSASHQVCANAGPADREDTWGAVGGSRCRPRLLARASQAWSKVGTGITVLCPGERAQGGGQDPWGLSPRGMCPRCPHPRRACRRPALCGEMEAEEGMCFRTSHPGAEATSLSQRKQKENHLPGFDKTRAPRQEVGSGAGTLTDTRTRARSLPLAQPQLHWWWLCTGRLPDQTTCGLFTHSPPQTFREHLQCGRPVLELGE